MPDTVWTVGHSTHEAEEFLDLLAAHGIEAVADVRRFPGSRRNPQFKEQALSAALATRGIEYRWIPELGGRRRPLPDSHNMAWRNEAFRGYADHMESEEFARGMQTLLELAARRRTAIMCAEAPWWRCHRALLSDALAVRGLRVLHIVDATHTTEHPMTSAARIVEGRLSYGGEQGTLL